MALNTAALGRYLTGTIPNHTSANDKAGAFPEYRDKLDVAFKHYSLGLASGATQPLGTSDEGDIRLLEIFPHPTGSGRIRGALHHYCFLVPARRISYKALSYAWGDQDEDRLIVIDGKGFLVTENLQTILWRLRRPDRSVYVWIDAICIYQKMTQEKEVQLAMMNDIYSTADEVVVYLGEQANDSEIAVDFAETVMTKLMALHDRQPDVAVVKNELEKFGLPPASHRGWKALRDVFNRPWFERKWIVQEYALAKLITCVLGNTSFNFELLVLVHKLCLSHKLDWISLHSPFSPRSWLTENWKLTIPREHPLTVLMTIREHIRHNFDNDPRAEVKRLPWLLAATSYAKVSRNPHDHIYALLGMHQVSGTLLGLPYPVINYNRSVEDVFIDYACIDDWKTSNTDSSLLELACQRKNYNLPSWVPDWSRSTSLIYVLHPGPGFGQGASNGADRSGFIFRRAAKSLTVKAKIIDSITQVVGRLESDWSVEWDKIRLQKYDYISSLREMANFATSKGYKILAAEGCRAGDRLVVILGERIPFVVRPRGTDWELVGCAYFSDIMEGQALAEYGKFSDSNDSPRSLTLV